MKNTIITWLAKNGLLVSDSKLLTETIKDRKLRMLKISAAFFVIALPFVILLFLSLYLFISSNSSFLIIIGLLVTVLLSSIAVWELAKKQRLVTASWLQLGNLYVFIALLMLVMGTDYSSNLTVYILIVVLAVLLLSQKATILVIFLSSGTGVFFLVAEKILKLYTPILQLDSQPKLYTLTALWGMGIVIISLAIVLLFSSFQRLSILSQNQNQDLQTALENLRERQEIGQEFSHQVLSTTNELSLTAQKQSIGSQQQASAITEVSSSLAELTQTATSIAYSARQVADAVEGVVKGATTVEATTSRATKASQEGREAVSSTINISQQVGMLYGTLGNTLLTLSQRTENIKMILNLIDQVSDETHLLALNAAIEAAGAGKAGLRFGIVAQEVKQLADRTREAGQDVRELITQIENGVAQAVMTAESGNKVAASAITTAQSSDGVITRLAEVVEQAAIESREILTRVQNVLQLSEEIELATRQQQSAGEQILQTLREVGSVAQENASGSQQISVTAHQLEEMTNNLKAALVA